MGAAEDAAAFARKRERMVERQIAARGITDARVLAAMREVPRHAFVGLDVQRFAYEDSALPIDAGQTISQPYIVARMAELAAIGPDDTVLEVGAGSGYAAAVLSRLGARVVAIERLEVLANSARARIEKMGFDNVEIIHGDGSEGWSEAAPYDAILVAAGGKAIPEALKEQLALGGRLVIPLSRGRYQMLTRLVRKSAEEFEAEEYGLVAFVPLVGAPVSPARRTSNMAAITRTAQAEWQGTGKDGKGMLSTQSGALSARPYGFKTRFGDEKGTNPEELIAAAHAGCFSMALAFALEGAGFTATRIATSAAVTLESEGTGFKISKSALKLEASVPKISREEFGKIAEGAKAGCPVSKVLNAQITLDWQLA